MGSTMPPTGRGEGKEKKSIGLTPAIWNEIDKIRESLGEDLSETTRRIIMAGLDAETERERQRLITRRLRAKEAKAEDAVDRLKAHPDPAVQAEALLIEKWLQKG